VEDRRSTDYREIIASVQPDETSPVQVTAAMTRSAKICGLSNFATSMLDPWVCDPFSKSTVVVLPKSGSVVLIVPESGLAQVHAGNSGVPYCEPIRVQEVEEL
jgi:hypothetical protein